MQLEADILIIGAGQAGAQTAAELRRRGFCGSVLLVGDEPDEPYARPPLSKAYLIGQMNREQLRLQSSLYWSEARIERRSGIRVTGLNPAARTAKTADGDCLSYCKLVWAGGGGARRLGVPGGDLRGVYTLRTRDDADRIRAALGGASNIVMIGGGYIGLEAAASARSTDKNVTVIEAQDRLLARSAAPLISQALEAEHRTQGVRILTGVAVAALCGRDGHVTHVELADGGEIAADLVVVGVGLAPHDAPLAAVGAAVEDGVLIDLQCRTSLPHVFAVGDCTRQARACAQGRALRLESVANALDQATVAAAALLDQSPPSATVPWFWSDQYDLRLQTVGLSVGYDNVVQRGDPASDRFSVVYLRGDQVVALDCLNASADFLAGKRLIAQGACPDRVALADPELPLKALIPGKESDRTRRAASTDNGLPDPHLNPLSESVGRGI